MPCIRGTRPGAVTRRSVLRRYTDTNITITGAARLRGDAGAGGEPPALLPQGRRGDRRRERVNVPARRSVAEHPADDAVIPAVAAVAGERLVGPECLRRRAVGQLEQQG